MATVNITFFNPYSIRQAGLIIEADNYSGEDIISSSTSQQSSVATEDSICRIAVSSGGDVYAEFGTDPTAADETTFRLLAGTVEYFHIHSGYKVAIIDPSV